MLGPPHSTVPPARQAARRATASRTDRDVQGRTVADCGSVLGMIVDVWMQHPTLRFLQHDMFASLRRWTGQTLPGDQPPIEATVAAMDHAGVGFGLLSTWSAPRQPPLIANDEVAEHLDDLDLDGET